MLALLRSSLNTWPVRIFFILLIAAFGLWGIGNVLPDILGSDRSAAHVGGVAISPQDVQNAYRQQIQQTAQQLGSADQITPEMRMMIAEQSAARLVAQTATDQMANRMGLAAPDADVRREVFAMDAFQDPNHQFSRARFDQLLQANGLSETEFLHLMQAQIIRNQLLDSVRAAATAPGVMVKVKAPVTLWLSSSAWMTIEVCPGCGRSSQKALKRANSSPFGLPVPIAKPRAESP